MGLKRNDMILTPMGLRYRGRLLPCSIGRGGISANKHEGDGATPSGIHEIVGCLYRRDRIAGKAVPRWAVPIRPFDLWCDAPDHVEYNQMVTTPFAASAEKMARPDPMYDVVLVTDWNWPEAQPGRGSAIFLHVWRRPGWPTAGCVAMALPNLLWLANRLQPGDRLIVPGLS